MDLCVCIARQTGGLHLSFCWGVQMCVRDGEWVSDGTWLGGAQRPSASLIRSGDEEAAGSAEVELVVEVNGQAEEKQQEGEERSTVCEERGEEESSVFTKPLRSIVIGCSDSVFASLTKRIVSRCCCCCYYYYCSCSS